MMVESPSFPFPSRPRRHLWDLSPSPSPSSSSPSPLVKSSESLDSLRASNAALLTALFSLSPSLSPSLSTLSTSLATARSALSSSHALSSPDLPLDRRLYVGSLSYDITEALVAQIFSVFGQVDKVDMPKEPGQGRSKGFCFVEFASPEAARKAEAVMSGVVVRGRPMKVGKPSGSGVTRVSLTEREWEEAREMAQRAALLAGGGGGDTFSVSSSSSSSSSSALPLSLSGERGPSVMSVMSEKELYASALALSQARTSGEVSQTAAIVNPSITFTSSTTPSPASAASTSPFMHRVMVSNLLVALTKSDVRELFSSFGTCHVIMDTARQGSAVVEFQSRIEAENAANGMDGLDFMGQAMRCTLQSSAPILPQFVRDYNTNAMLNESATETLRNEDNMTISSHSQRHDIMNKLAASRPSSVLLLTNMVSAADIDDELEADVRSECAKYGQVQQVKILPDYQHDTARIFVEFSSTQEATRAIGVMNGRFFGGRTVAAVFFPLIRWSANLLTD